MKKLRFVTRLYGVAAILVVFGHSHPLHTEYPKILHEVISFLYTFHMPLFFTVAGILLSYTESARRYSISVWWKKKCTKLLLPYLVLTLIAWLPKTLLNQYMNDDMEISFLNLIKIIFVPRSGIWGHFWFIPVYLVLILLGACWIRIAKQNLYIKIGTVLIAVIFNLFPISVDWLGIEDITKNFLYILLGIIFSDFIIERQDIKYGFLKGMTGIFMAVIIYFVVRKNVFVDIGQCTVISGLTIGLLTDRLTCLFMLYSMICLSLEIVKYPAGWLDYIGNHAFTIYIYSWPIQAVLELVFIVLLGGGWLVGYFAMFFGGLIGPLIILEIYLKKLKRNAFLDGMIGVK